MSTKKAIIALLAAVAAIAAVVIIAVASAGGQSGFNGEIVDVAANGTLEQHDGENGNDHEYDGLEASDATDGGTALIDRGAFVGSSVRATRVDNRIDVTGIVNYMNAYNANAGSLAIFDYNIKYDDAEDVYRIVGGSYSLALVLDEFGRVLYATPDSGAGKDGERMVPASLINALGSGDPGVTSLMREIIRRDLDMKIYLIGIKEAILSYYEREHELDLELMQLPRLPYIRHFTPADLQEPYVEPYMLPGMTPHNIDDFWTARLYG